MLLTKQKHFLIAQKCLLFPTPISATLSCPEGDLMAGAHTREQKHFPFLPALRRQSRKQRPVTLSCQLQSNSFLDREQEPAAGSSEILGFLESLAGTHSYQTHPSSSSTLHKTRSFNSSWGFPVLSLSLYSTIHTVLLHSHNLEEHTCWQCTIKANALIQICIFQAAFSGAWLMTRSPKGLQTE